MTSPVSGLLDRRVAADGASPLITYYDDDTGERTELSAVSLANWVAKAANLLQDGLDVEPGHRVAVMLEPHWQAAAVLLGAWAVGATVTEAVPCEILVVPEQRMLDYEDEEIGHILGLSLHPLGGRLGTYVQPTAGMTDFAAEVPVYGDQFAPYTPVDPAGTALVIGDLRWTAADLVAAARAMAERLGLGPDDRVLVDVETGHETGPLVWLLAPLAVGASVVLCRRPDPAGLARRAATERVTVSVGVHVEGVRAAGR